MAGPATNSLGPIMIPSSIVFFKYTSEYPAPSAPKSRIVVIPASNEFWACTVPRITLSAGDSLST